MKPMDETPKEILEWGILHDALIQAAGIVYQLFANGGAFARKVPVTRHYRTDEERGPVQIWWQGRAADKLYGALPPGSITYTFNHPTQNGVYYYETNVYAWEGSGWKAGAKEELFMTVGGVFSKPVVLEPKEGFERWAKGLRIPLSS
jgi:hypothetical protein